MKQHRGCVVALFLMLTTTPVFLTDSDTTQDSCFCQLKGELDDCSCTVENIDSFNNLKIHPRLNSLLEKDYFRYFKLNLFRPCPFDSDNIGVCASKSCAVDECKEDQLPEGFKEKENHSNTKNKHDKYSQEANDNFCELDDEDSKDAMYYDLIRNPERFTGYTGPSAVNVWKLIYDQNCFKPDQPDISNYLPPQQGMCLEKRVFYRMISGFHTSINVDITANWLFPAKNAWGEGTWGPNVEEFNRRFDPKLTWGQGPDRLKNLYFTYLVELRALVKVAPYLEQEKFYTGNEKEDTEVKKAVKDLLKAIKELPDQFDESKLFKGDAQKLKENFKVHFRNISRIMDCVGCDKCRLWGKLQITGMGTALKILFSGDSMGPESQVTQQHKKGDVPFQLSRGEIVALINGFGRISKSIHEVDNFRKMLS